VAEVIADYLTQPQGNMPALASLPMHLVGHSKGAALVSQIARFLGRKSVVVDHVTFLDPVPVAGLPDSLNDQFGEGSIRPFDNVVFADTYWRSGGADLSGAYINGTYDGNVNDTVGQHYLVSAHGAVPAYYVGTINPSATTAGDHPIYSDWYGDGAPARDQTGYAFARLGATAARPAQGLGSLAGGSASRTDAGSSGSQWPAVVEIKPRNGTSFPAGSDFNVGLRAGDSDSSAGATIYLDTDRNPYNGAGTQIGTLNIAQGGVSDLIAALRAAGVTPGSYALALAVSDTAGRTLWNYGRSLTIAPSGPIGVVESRVLTINGTDGNDAIALRFEGGSIVGQLNGVTESFDPADFDRIVVLCGAGADVLSTDVTVSVPIYADGGVGNDNLTGGSGNDTLTAGAGKNTLWGGSGDDRLNGSGGRDLAYGGDGADRMYGNGGDDTLDGGGSVDRLWGGDGNDLLIGGGSNDKLYGDAGDDVLLGRSGADLVDGGDGVDTAEGDASDLRNSIEALR
jgi:Ca2+-binding RTX toxin-like protein